MPRKFPAKARPTKPANGSGKAPVASQPLLPCATLESFRDGAGPHSGFHFTRYWWQNEGPREGIRPHFEKKLSFGDDPRFGSAIRHDLLLPPGAPADYMDVAHLLQRYDAMLPAFFYDAFVQVKIDLPETEPLHVGFEMVRAYAWRHFVLDLDLPVLLVLHAPFLAGSPNNAHVHLLVPARELGPNGWGRAARGLCCDPGHRACWAAWQAFRREWQSALKQSSMPPPGDGGPHD